MRNKTWWSKSIIISYFLLASTLGVFCEGSVFVKGKELPPVEILRQEEGDSYTKRKVAHVALANGLQVFLISDPECEESAAGLCVRVGSWNDTPDYPGLAHFVEHLLFMGTKAFPGEEEFSQFISDRGGEYNAYTMHDRTVYGFSVAHGSFKSALNRFSHFFLDPLFSSSAIEREKHAVHHEFEDNIENESIRIWRIIKETGNPTHPNAVFSCGNLSSLHEVTRQQVLSWYDQYYTAQNMVLVLVSKGSIEEQIDLAAGYFSQIKPGKKESKVFSEPLTTAKQQGHVCYIKPALRARFLRVLWELPVDRKPAEALHVAQAMQEALDHSQKHSLERALSGEGWSYECDVSLWMPDISHLLFAVDVELTPSGLQEIDAVILRINEALKRLKQEKISQIFYEDLESYMRRSTFWDSPFFLATDLAEDLLDDSSLVFTKDPRDLSYCSELFDVFIEQMTPARGVYFVVADPKETGVVYSSLERWMKSEYTVRQIAQEKIDSWSMAEINPYIQLKAPSQEESPSREYNCDDDERNEPELIIEEELGKLYRLEDQEKSSLRLNLFSPSISTSPKNAALTSLHREVLQDECSNRLGKKIRMCFLEEEDGIFEIFISSAKEDFTHCVYGWIATLQEAFCTKERFLQWQDRWQKEEICEPEPLQYAYLSLEKILSPTFYPRYELQKVIKDVTYEDYLEFVSHFLDQLYLEITIAGSYEKEEMQEYWDIIKAQLGARPYSQEERTALLSSHIQEQYPYIASKDVQRNSSASLLMIDLGSYSSMNRIKQWIVNALVEQAFFEELRTKQQTAYTLSSWDEVRDDHLLQYFGLQSSTYGAEELLRRTEQFLQGFIEEKNPYALLKRFATIRHTLMEVVEKENADEGEEEEAKQQILSILEGISFDEIKEMMSEAFSKVNDKRAAILIKGQAEQSSFSLAENF